MDIPSDILSNGTYLHLPVPGVLRCRYQLLPLHSLVAPAEQRRVFVRPPPGVRKIVMATNIAGASYFCFLFSLYI